MNLVRILFKLASIANTAKIVSSGKPKRIGKHIVRRQVHKALSKWLRKL